MHFRKWVWDPSDIFKDLMDFLGYHIVNPKKLREFDQLPVENFDDDAMAHTVLARLMGKIAGMTFTLNPDGDVVIINGLDGSEEDEVEKLRPNIVQGGDLVRQDYRFIRPSKIIIKFTREHEVRFDFRSGVRSIATNRFMQNVMPLPDLKLTIAGQ